MLALLIWSDVMRIKKLRVEGFESFQDTGEVHFSKGINLIIGQNNSGKSALLRSLRPGLPDHRHTSPEKWEAFKLSLPKVTYVMEATGNELKDWILQSGGQHFIPINEEPLANTDDILMNFFQHDEVEVEIFVRAGSGVGSAWPYPSHRKFERHDNRFECLSVIVDNASLNVSRQHNQNDSLPGLFWWAWGQRAFHFDAQRMTIGEAPGGRRERLDPNAGNLPNVLHTLANERGDVFRDLVHNLNSIFPTVGNLSVRTKPDGNFLEVRVWPTEAMLRPELSFPLNDSGTGVAQAIAILTAIMTIEESGVIIIDEINTFLHPSAIKALLRIIHTKFSKHQYIISTHSPEVVNFGNPDSVHLVKRLGYESSVEEINVTKIDGLRYIADNLGVSMADVFAADRVVWVEGPTEELCFPYIYQEFWGKLPRGVYISSVSTTGDFFTNKRDVNIVLDVYSRLASATASLLVSVVFSFDSEKLSSDQKRELVSRSCGRLFFLPRRHFECYLIDPEAMLDLLREKDADNSTQVTRDEVEGAIRRLASDVRFAIPEWNDDIFDQNWLAYVDAANLIDRVLADLSDERVRFAKNRDSLYLLKI